MLRGGGYRVGEREYGSLEVARAEMRRIEGRLRLLAVAQEVAKERDQ
jgi:hypothetical protein